MPTTVSGNVIRVAARHTFDGVDEQVNVFHFTVNDDPVAPADNLLLIDVSELLTTVYTHIAVDMPNIVDAQDITVYNVTQDYPLGVVDWSGGYAGGTGSGESLPPGTSALILWRTATKRVLGKTFLPTYLEATQSAGTLVSTTQTRMEAFIAEMRDGAIMTGGYSFQPIVWSRAAGEARPIVSARPAVKIAYQRRRKAGVGS